MYSAIVSFFQEGGVFMYPIVVVLALGLAIAVERWFYLTMTTASNKMLWNKVSPYLKSGNFSGLLGAPCIYYGDEVGLSAGGDPYCREAFPWHTPETWDQELLAFYRQVIALRHRHPVLRTGTFRSAYAEGMVYAFQRVLDDQVAVVIFNAGKESVHCSFGLEGSIPQLTQIWPADSGVQFSQDGRAITANLTSQSALILIS